MYLVRHVVFLFLPIIVQLLPSAPIAVPLTPILIELKAVVDSLSKRQTLLKFLRPAIAREDQLRDASSSAWIKQKKSGQWVREDRGVWNVASQFIVGGAGQRGAAGKESEEVLKGKIHETVGELMKVASQTPVPPPSL